MSNGPNLLDPFLLSPKIERETFFKKFQKRPTLTVSPSLLQTLDLWGGQTCWEISRRRLIIPCLPPKWPRPPKSTTEESPLHRRRSTSRGPPCPDSRGLTTHSNTMSIHCAKRPRARRNFAVLSAVAPSISSALCCGMSGTSIKADLCRIPAVNVAKFSNGPTI